jgi:hypothetical protein
MKTIPLYNQDGSLIKEAVFLLSDESCIFSRKERRMLFKKFYEKLSPEDCKNFKRLLSRKAEKKHKSKMDPKKRKALYKKYRFNNLEKIKERESRYRNKHRKEACLRSSNYRAKNPEKVKASQANWYLKNRDQERARRKIHYHKNKEKLKHQRLEQYEKNKEKIKLSNNKWRAKNPGYNKKTRTKNPFAYCMRNICWRVVKQLKLGKKPVSAEKWFGCSAEQLKAYIERLWQEGMSWENYGHKGWHVDHIRPVSDFKQEELISINHYTNLQPLWAKDNLKKSNKIIT